MRSDGSRSLRARSARDVAAILKDDQDRHDERRDHDQHGQAAPHGETDRRVHDRHDEQDAVAEQAHQPRGPEIPVGGGLVAHRRKPQPPKIGREDRSQQNLGDLDQQEGIEKQALAEIHPAGLAEGQREGVAPRPGDQDDQRVDHAGADQPGELRDPAAAIGARRHRPEDPPAERAQPRKQRQRHHHHERERRRRALQLVPVDLLGGRHRPDHVAQRTCHIAREPRRALGDATGLLGDLARERHARLGFGLGFGAVGHLLGRGEQLADQRRARRVVLQDLGEGARGIGLARGFGGLRGRFVGGRVEQALRRGSTGKEPREKEGGEETDRSHALSRLNLALP